jgi:hypothetical protein
LFDLLSTITPMLTGSLNWSQPASGSATFGTTRVLTEMMKVGSISQQALPADGEDAAGWPR